MRHIKGTKITFEYSGQIEPLFENLNFEIGKNSKVGLIGRNGTGKTTLFGIILKSLKPCSGEIDCDVDQRVGYLPQEVNIDDSLTVQDYLWQSNCVLNDTRDIILNSDSYSNEIYIDALAKYEELGGYEYENEIIKQLSKFQLGKSFLKRRVATLSGGEKTKVALLRVMVSSPHLLMLDEPTNHLDSETLLWLEGYLSALRIPFIVISHDRRFLDSCVSTIWELKNKTLRVFSGNYSFYKMTVEKELEKRLVQYEEHKKKVSKMRSAITQRRDDAHKMENFKLKRSVKKNGGICKRDDGSGSGKSDPLKKMRSATALSTRLEKLIEQEEAKQPFIEKKREIKLLQNSTHNTNTIQIRKLRKSFNSNHLVNNLTLTIKNGERVAVTGRNGSGKSTLLKILAGKLTPCEGELYWSPQAKVEYFAQEHETLNFKNTIIEEVLQGDQKGQTLARTVLACLNIRGDKVHQTIKTLSLGERSKVSIAKIIVSDANVLILDEPVNHLEIDAREGLERALESFSGTIIFVSHDREFREKIANSYLDIETGLKSE